MSLLNILNGKKWRKKLNNKKLINPNFRRYGIIPNMRKLSGKIYPDFENTVKYISDNELKNLNSFLMEMVHKINSLEKIQKRLF